MHYIHIFWDSLRRVNNGYILYVKKIYFIWAPIKYLFRYLLNIYFLGCATRDYLFQNSMCGVSERHRIFEGARLKTPRPEYKYLLLIYYVQWRLKGGRSGPPRASNRRGIQLGKIIYDSPRNGLKLSFWADTFSKFLGGGPPNPPFMTEAQYFFYRGCIIFECTYSESQLDFFYIFKLLRICAL